MPGVFRQYSWIIDIIGILLCSFFLAKISGVYIGKMMEVEKAIGIRGQAEAGKIERQVRPREEYAAIVDRNMFDPSDKKADEQKAVECVDGDERPECAGTGLVAPTGEAVKTSLSLTVIGVMVVGNGLDGRSTATITGGGGGGGSKDKKSAASSGSGGGVKSGVYAVGVSGEESFAPNTKLTKVAPDRIEFLNNNRLEYAEVGNDSGDSIFGPPKHDEVATSKGQSEKPSGDKKGPAEVPDKMVLDQRELKEALDDPTKLLTDMRAVPQYSGGKVAGLKVLSIKQGSMFSKLGMQRGDVLQRINGMDLDVKKGLEMFNTLKEEKNIKLDILRNGQPTTLEYEIR